MNNKVPRGGANVICPACGTVFAFNEYCVPPGEEYKIHCINCGLDIIKKKPNNENEKPRTE